MRILKCFLIIFLSCAINGSLSTSSESNITEGRGFASTIWEWITYPFTWWYYGSNEPPTTESQAIITTTLGPYDNVEVAKRNITIWCNDQTCTTMKCDDNGCRNITCSIYDTDVTGECREYNILLKPDMPIQPEPTKPVLAEPEISTKAHLTTTTVTKAPEISTTLRVTRHSTEKVQERPLELEAVLSSTVVKTSRDKDIKDTKVNNTINLQNKV